MGWWITILQTKIYIEIFPFPKILLKMTFLFHKVGYVCSLMDNSPFLNLPRRMTPMRRNNHWQLGSHTIPIGQGGSLKIIWRKCWSIFNFHCMFVYVFFEVPQIPKNLHDEKCSRRSALTVTKDWWDLNEATAPTSEVNEKRFWATKHQWCDR